MARADREQVILRAAGQVFARMGYHAASVTEIAELGGVSKPMVYRYFGSKEAVYAAYVRVRGDELRRRVEEAAAAAERTTRDRLRAGVDAFLAFVEERSEGWSVLFGELASPGSALHADVSRVRALLVEGTASMLERDGASAQHAAARAVALVGGTEALANWWLAESSMSREAVVDVVLASL